MAENIGNRSENPESHAYTAKDQLQSIHPQLSYECLKQPCGGCSELAEAEAQIAIAQNLDIARKRQAQAKSNLNLWHDRLLVRLLPEIVSEIFIFVSCSEGGPEPLHKTNRALCTSLLLARICQRWRAIALATPQLWTDIRIDIIKHSTQLDITKEMLLRSRSLPLNLSFYEEFVPSIQFPLDPLMNIIRSHSARWQHLDLNDAGNNKLSHLIPLIPKLLHNLEAIPISDCLELHLGRVGCVGPIALPGPLRPRVFQSRINAHSTNIPLQWDNLTHLDVEYFGVTDFLAIVHNAPRLIDLTARDLRGQAHPTFLTPVIHHSLKNLTLTHDIGYDGDILSHITLPSLRCLECKLGSRATLMLDVLIDFFNRSDLKPGSLQTFQLRYVICGEDYDHRFIELTALTHLGIHIYGPSQKTHLHPYLCQLSVPSTLPNLRYLAIFGGDIVSPASWALLSKICQDRSSNKAVGPTSAFLKESTSGRSTTDEINSLESKTSPSLSGTVERRYRRPLEYLSMKCCPRPDRSTMEKDVLLRFLEVQRAGVVKLELLDEHLDDVLKTMAKIYGCQSRSQVPDSK